MVEAREFESEDSLSYDIDQHQIRYSHEPDQLYHFKAYQEMRDSGQPDLGENIEEDLLKEEYFA